MLNQVGKKIFQPKISVIFEFLDLQNIFLGFRFVSTVCSSFLVIHKDIIFLDGIILDVIILYILS